MKKKTSPILVILGLMLLVAAGYFGFRFAQRYIPSKEQADIEKLLGVSEDEVALYLNNELQETKGIYHQEQTYLPLKWINANLNERFYWDQEGEFLMYTLPESIVYADHATIGDSGKPLLWVKDQDIYLSLGLVVNYTDLRTAAYDSGLSKRVFLDNTWNSEEIAEVVRTASIRVKGGIKSPVLAEAVSGARVTVLESMKKWLKVRTQDGFIGYIQRSCTGKSVQEIPVSTFTRPVYNNISMKEPVCLVWHQVTSQEGNASFDSLIENTKGVNVISPTWYELTDNEGNFRSLANLDYVKKAHNKGLKVWALVNNFNSDVNTEVLMSKNSVRKKLVQALIAEAQEYDFDGINLDFEGIKEEAGRHYIQFIRELSILCRQKGIVLSVDNYVPAFSNQFYNRKEQGIVADYVIIMGYDEHYAGGGAGSVASIGYTENGIKDTLAEVPKGKVIHAIPFYTRIWTETAEGKTNSSSVGIAKAVEWAAENNVDLNWQEETGQYYGELQTSEGVKKVWMEEERSIGLKMNLVKKYGLAGVACWKLGFEPPQLWEEVRLDKNKE